MSHRIIPFAWLPASWGLKGKSREIAQAEYELEGKELERKLIELKLSGVEREIKLLELDLSGEELDRKLIEIKYNGVEQEIKLLECDLKYGKVKEVEYEKKMATLKHEPWVRILNTDYDPTEPLTGSLDIDWNEYFIKSLEDAGYVAPNDYEMVDQWLTELCRNIATETYGGVGTFDDDSQNVINVMKGGNAR